MRSLNRNKTDFWYANYHGKEEILKNGKRTGQYKVLYSNPVKISENISAARGSLDNELFGIQTDYDRTITSCNRDFDISESSVLWIEKTPEVAYDGSTDTPCDYVVVKVARSINSVTVAIRKVSVQ